MVGMTRKNINKQLRVRANGFASNTAPWSR
jgi:hypothetical protein